MAPAHGGYRTRPTAFLFDAQAEKARRAPPITIPKTAGNKPSLSDHDDGVGGVLETSTPGAGQPLDGQFLEKRADSGDIEGGNAVDSVAEVAEQYLLAGSDEEAYRSYEETVAADSFLDTTFAMLHPQHQHQHQQQMFLFGGNGL